MHKENKTLGSTTEAFKRRPLYQFTVIGICGRCSEDHAVTNILECGRCSEDHAVTNILECRRCSEVHQQNKTLGSTTTEYHKFKSSHSAQNKTVSL